MKEEKNKIFIKEFKKMKFLLINEKKKEKFDSKK